MSAPLETMSNGYLPGAAALRWFDAAKDIPWGQSCFRIEDP
jgi:hypothetical protein